MSKILTPPHKKRAKKAKAPPPVVLTTLADLKADPINPRKIDKDELAGLAVSMDRFGDLSGITFNVRTGELVAGHQRLRNIREAHGDLKLMRDGGKVWIETPNGDVWAVRLVEWTPAKQRAANIAANSQAIAGQFTDELQPQLKDILAEDAALYQALRFDELEREDQQAISTQAKATLAEKFLVPPFSILDTKQGYWQDRKTAWKDLGIKSEVGRGPNLLKMSETVLNPTGKKRKGDSKAGLTFGSGLRGAEDLSGTSIFDPVLAEVMYKWFCPPAGTIVDPFAGGSVRGIVAGYLGYRYLGMDLRPEQVQANQAQLKDIKCAVPPRWAVGDSLTIREKFGKEKADFIFSCPPYHDLEQYSEDPKDLSNMPWDKFADLYSKIIVESMALLKPDRFACFVVGDLRDKGGFYRNFPDLTKTAFLKAGAQFYNEIVLINAIGTLPIRIGRQFVGFRKVGKCHQNVMVFFRGDPQRIKESHGEIEVPDLSKADAE